MAQIACRSLAGGEITFRLSKDRELSQIHTQIVPFKAVSLNPGPGLSLGFRLSLPSFFFYPGNVSRKTVEPDSGDLRHRIVNILPFLGNGIQ